MSIGSLEALPGYHPSRNNWGPLVVPDKNYFVLGDNRDNSLDSRYWGFVADSLVRGQPMVVYYSYDPDWRGETRLADPRSVEAFRRDDPVVHPDSP